MDRAFSFALVSLAQCKDMQHVRSLASQCNLGGGVPVPRLFDFPPIGI